MSDALYDSRRQRSLRGLPRDLIRSRELLRDLIWKELSARYRYAVMGFLWAVIEPLALMLILTFVFTVVMKAKADLAGGGDGGPPFAVMLLCGLVFWQYMAAAVDRASRSLIDNANLVKKVQFAREVVPLAALGYPMINLGVGVVVLLIVHVAMGGGLSPAIVWFVPVFLIQLFLAAGLALLLSCSNVHFRDVGYVVTVGLTFGFYASPIFYPLELVTGARSAPAWAVKLYMLNPMAELLTAYRQILFEQRFPDLALLVWPAILAVLLLIIGTFIFRRTGPTLSDHL